MDDATAKQLVDSLGLTPRESLFVRGVAKHETDYGEGWKKRGMGVGSNNMGAITTAHPDALSFRHPDVRNDQGKLIQYTTWFAGYATPLDGFKGLVRTLLKPNVKEALERGDLRAAVAAQHANGYFLGVHRRDVHEEDEKNVDDYFEAVRRNLEKLATHTGEEVVAVWQAHKAGVSGVAVGVLALFGAGLAWWWRSRG